MTNDLLLREEISIPQVRQEKEYFTFFDNSGQKNLLESYFQKSPDERIKDCQNVASYIETVDEIVEILQLGNKNSIRDGYDGAISILAECSPHLLIRLMCLGQYPNNQYIDFLTPEQWEILIKSVACSQKIKAIEKYSLIIGFMNNYEFYGRLIKSAIIDFLWILEDELDDFDLIRLILERFIHKDPDSYIREYAQEALDDISPII